MVQLDPATYKCPSHNNQDLTAQVRELAEEMAESLPFAYGWRRRSAKEEFEFIVSCPGDGTTPDTAHPQPFEGRYSR
jgi:hypothetical protein